MSSISDKEPKTITAEERSHFDYAEPELEIEYELPEDLYIDDDFDVDGGLDEIMFPDGKTAWFHKIEERAKEIAKRTKSEELFSLEMRELGRLLEETIQMELFHERKEHNVKTAAELLLTAGSMRILIGACSVISGADEVQPDQNKKMLPIKRNAIIGNLEQFYRLFSGALENTFVTAHLGDERSATNRRRPFDIENTDSGNTEGRDELLFHIYKSNLDILRSCWFH